MADLKVQAFGAELKNDGSGFKFVELLCLFLCLFNEGVAGTGWKIEM
jgi:hypothetical protein